MKANAMAARHGTVRPMMAVMVLFAVLLGAAGVMAQGWSDWVSDPNDVIKYRAKFESGTLTVEAELAPDPDSPDGSTHKTYALDNEARGGIGANTKLTVSGGLSVSGPWTSSPVKDLTTEGIADFGFKGTAWFKAPATVTTGATATVTVVGMVCNAFSCLPPHELSITVSLAAPAPTDTKPPAPKAGVDPKEPMAQWTAWKDEPKSGNGFVKYRARLEQRNDRPTLVVEAEHAEHYHTYHFENSKRRGYSYDTVITVSGALQADGPWTSSKEPKQKIYPQEMIDTFPKGQDTDWYWEGTVQFYLPVKRLEGDSATISIDAQVCSDECYDWKGLLITLPDGSAATKPAEAAPSKPKTSARPPKGGDLYPVKLNDGTTEWRLGQFAGAKDGSDLTGGDDLGAFLLLCLFGGLVALLMPCVFPMIPITVSFFGKQAEQRGGSTVGLGLVYAFGVVFSYSVLGSVLTAIYGASGVSAFAGDAKVAVAIAILFFVFALSMFGMFELRLPYSIQQKFNIQGKASSGMLGSFLLGATFAVTSMACTVPVVGSIFALAADGNILKPLLGMIVFSSVVAAPFFILAVIPGALKKLPRGGGWMNAIKVVFGFIELAAAAEFLGLARIIPREWVLAIWIACFLLSSGYLIGLFRGLHDAPTTGISAIRMVFASLFLGVALWLGTGIYGGGNLGFIESFLINEIGWEKNVDLKPALEAAKARRQPVYLDFTGANCANCRLFEKGALDQPWGKEALTKYAKYALYTDSTPHGAGYVEMTRKLFGYAGQPAYVVINAEGQITAWLADINTVLKASNPKEVFEEFVKTGEGPGFDWTFEKGFAPPK